MEPGGIMVVQYSKHGQRFQLFFLKAFSEMKDFSIVNMKLLLWEKPKNP